MKRRVAAASGLAGAFWLLGTRVAWADVVPDPGFLIGVLAAGGVILWVAVAFVTLVSVGSFLLLRRIVRRRRAEDANR